MRIGVHLILSLVLPMTVLAQPYRFTITSCPAVSGVAKADFNAHYGQAGSQAEYTQALRRTFTGDKGGRYVHYTERKAGDVEADFVFNIPTGRSHPADLVSLASKGVASSTVESKVEVRALLHDTVALWDTLRMRMRLLDADLANTGYFLVWTDTRDGATYKSNVPARGDTLCFSADLFGGKPLVYVPVRLRHTALRKQDLATFTLRILSSDEKTDLLGAVCDVASRTPGLNAVQRAQLAHQYCTAEYGSIPAEQLPQPPCPSPADH
ncbi:MAG: hypothetical protein ABI432_17515 [Flavobacteriales bacterium]